MKRQIKLLYFSSNEWGNLGRRKVRLAYEFARQEEAAAVLYVNPPVRSSVLDVVRGRFEPSHLGGSRRVHVNALLGRGWQVAERLWVHTGSTKTIPLTRSERLRRSPVLNRANDWLYGALVRHQLRLLPGDKVVVWLSHPLQVSMLDVFPERSLACFDWTDDWTQFSILPAARDEIDHATERVLREVDAVFAVSESLCRRAGVVNSNTHRAPNATDFELLSASAAGDLPSSPDLTAVPPPRLGYVGQIGENIDYSLVRAVAEMRPDWSLVFVGPIWSNQQVEVADLTRLGNVHFLGGRPHSELPGFFRGFDVCLMPHVRNALTVSMDPTKLYDYLASGKPIVSTRVAGTERVADALYVGDTAEDFVSGVEVALREDGTKANERLDYARRNAWPQRGREMWAVLSSCL